MNDQGLLIVRIKDGAQQSLSDTKENLTLAVSETRGQRRPLLIDIRKAQPLEADARHHYSGQTLVERFSDRLADFLNVLELMASGEAGEGWVFRVTLRPLQAVLEPARGVEPDAGDAAIRGMHVLLAEDHRDLHLAVRQFLERAGATVESAYDGRQAIEIAASVRFDVLLMDLRMPHMNGFAATRVLRARGYALPIIALTADPTTIYHEEALEAGCDACLAKPFKLAELSAAIRRASRSGR